jgi:tRNA pseudouridine65 synthase
MKPKTGRKHQLRRHMAHLRHPIVGDTTHGDGKHNRLYREVYDCHRLMLHASELRFVHPYTKQELVLKASFDESWQKLFAEFEWNHPQP